MISVKIHAQDIMRIAKTLPNQRDMLDLANEAVSVIKARTLQGVGVDGSGFADYSEGYAKYREKKGRTASVNLTFHGRMLGSMATTNIPNGSKIYFADADRRNIAAYHNTGAGRLPQREFFGLSPIELQRLSDAMFAVIMRRVAA
jgi:phage gpG-like protein